MDAGIVRAAIQCPALAFTEAKCVGVLLRPDNHTARVGNSMKPLIFFALIFPPGVMDLMVFQSHPTRLGYYFIAGYVIQIIPALVGLTDEITDRQSPLIRAGWCALSGFILTPIPVWLLGAYKGVSPALWQCFATGCAGALAAFLCTIAAHQLRMLISGRIARVPAS